MLFRGNAMTGWQVWEDQDKGHHPRNCSHCPGQLFQNRIYLLYKEPWAHTPLIRPTTQRESLSSAQVMRLGQRAMTCVRLQGANIGARQSFHQWAQCISLFFQVWRDNQEYKSLKHKGLWLQMKTAAVPLQTGFVFPRKRAFYQWKRAAEWFSSEENKNRLPCS